MNSIAYFVNRSGGVKAAVALIVIAASLIYANSLANEFAGDDLAIIATNNFIRSWKNFPDIFTRKYLSTASLVYYFDNYSHIGAGEISYRPVVTITYFLDYAIWKLNPFGYHLTNLLLHMFNGILLYFLVNTIARDSKIALVSALLFVLHPVNSEAVNVVAYREDLLALLFIIGSFITYIKYTACQGKAHRFYFYIGSIICFFLALFSKEMSVTFPFVLIAYDYFFKRSKRIFKPCYIGYFVCLLFYLWVFFFPMENRGEILAVYPGGSFYVNILTMCKVFAAYIKWFFIPLGLHLTFQDSSFFSYSFFKPDVLVSIFLIAAFVIMIFLIYRKSKIASFGILWFLITLFPVSNIWPLVNIIAARYLYIPAAGFCLALAVMIVRLPVYRIGNIKPKVLKVISRDIIVVLIVFYSIITLTRNYTFRNDLTLGSELAEYYPNSSYVHQHLGIAFMIRGRMQEARKALERGVELAPNNGWAHSFLGDCYFKEGMLDKATDEYAIAISHDPNIINAYNNLGSISVIKESYAESVEYFKKALEINPGFVRAHNNLGVAYAGLGKWHEAEKSWKKALEIDPGDQKAIYELKKLKEKSIKY